MSHSRIVNFSSIRQRRSLHGFTLIELLVVIAIISLLISILLPSLNKAKELSRQVVCQSNKRQASLSFMMYVQENDGSFPYNHRSGTLDTYAILNHFWTDDPQYYLIKPYVSADAIFQCPSAPEVLSTDGYPVTTTFFSNTLAGLEKWDDFADPKIDPVNIASIRNASETIMLGDSIPQTNMVWSPEANVFDYFRWGFLYNGIYCHGAAAGLRDNLYHNGGYTLSFVDGRAEWYPAGTEPIDDGTWWDLK
jgi:prepilin-type N-terminal cleavage/methylation domain-containing protein